MRNPKFNGLTDDQVLSLLERVATNINLMASICRDKAEEHGSDDVAFTFHALDVMLCGIGALADLPTNGNVVGTFADWMIGPVFKKGEDAKQAVKS